MINTIINLEYFSPTGLVGFLILSIGLIFTGIMFYFVFFRLTDDEHSFKDKKRSLLKKEKQKERIAKLYPKE